MNSVVVTAYGIVSSIGLEPKSFRTNLFNSVSGVRSIRGKWAAEDFPVPYAAWVDRHDLPKSVLYKENESVLKSWLMTEQVTAQVLGTLSKENTIDAIVYGTADGVSFEIAVDVLKGGIESEFDAEKTRCESSLNVLNEMLAHHGFKKVSENNLISVNAACASGNQTLGIAFEGIRSGRWKRCLVGGVDARCEPSNLLNFLSLGALTAAEIAPEKASRPFSKDRTGFVRGEGAALLLIESEAAALERKAKVLGTILGYGATSDAYRLTDGREDGLSVIEAMSSAIRDAGLVPKDIDYINAHGTSTQLNDRLETFAIKAVFGENAKNIPVSSIKSKIGHSTIAASSIEAIASLMMLDEQKISPTLNLDVADPECDLDYVPHVARPAKLNYVLSNSFGFGGQNTCLVMGRPKEIPHA
jgi:3-oxoacyl-[acyl-carrier-protein] synthase II